MAIIVAPISTYHAYVFTLLTHLRFLRQLPVTSRDCPLIATTAKHSRNKNSQHLQPSWVHPEILIDSNFKHINLPPQSPPTAWTPSPPTWNMPAQTQTPPPRPRTWSCCPPSRSTGPVQMQNRGGRKRRLVGCKINIEIKRKTRTRSSMTLRIWSDITFGPPAPAPSGSSENTW